MSHSVPYQDVALMLVVIERPIVDYMASSSPGVGQQMLHEVLAFGEVPHGPVLQHTSALIVAVHGPYLMEERQQMRWLITDLASSSSL